MTEEKVIKCLNKLKHKTGKVGHVLTDQEMERLESLLPIENLETLVKGFSEDDDVADALIAWAEDEVLAQDNAKALAKVELWCKKTANRSVYLPTSELRAYDYKEKGLTRPRIQYKNTVRCAGLLEQVVTNLHGHQDAPVGIYLQDKTELGLPDQVWEIMSAHKLRSSKGRLLWNQNSVAWQYLLRTFPVAVDLTAYGHSLMTPLVPHGYVPNCPVTFAVMKNNNGQKVGTDGSGIYHPEAPQMAELVAEYGPVAMQFRYMHPTGYFAKGMIFPSEVAVDENGAPTVMLDWLQIKGQFKKKAKENYDADSTKTVTGGHLGVFRYRLRATGLNSGFEMLENIQVNETTKAIVVKRTKKAVAKLIERGPEQLIRRVAAKDPNVKHMLRIVRVLAETGYNLSPLQVERIRSAVQDQLNKALRQIAWGGGIRFKAHDARLDSTIPRGRCIISGLPANVAVAAIRFPIVLSQGLVVLKTMKPRQHHMWAGSMAPGVVVMHPDDLVVKMQGDDDGDTIGISTDHEMVELFRHKVDNNIYHIETRTKRLEEQTDSEAGEMLMRHSQRGEVGLTTILRSQLLAVGDVAGANAMALGIQQCVDRTKNIVQYSDIIKAANLANWRVESDGYHFDHLFAPEATPIGVFPTKAIQQWTSLRLIKAGCYFEMPETGKVMARNPLTWRPKDKRIDINNWLPTKQKGWRGGNLVHVAHDAAWAEWTANSAEFKLDHELVDMEPLLYCALTAVGNETMPMQVSDEDYSRLYIMSGLANYNDDISQVQREDWAEEDRIPRINQLQQRLERGLAKMNLEELLTIWKMECRDGRVNNALRAVCWDHSPVLAALGLVENSKCNFLSPIKVQAQVKLAMADAKPHNKMTEMLMLGTKHQLAVKDDDGNEIPIWKCPECLDQLQDALVQGMRARDTQNRREFMNNLTHQVNALLRMLAGTDSPQSQDK